MIEVLDVTSLEWVILIGLLTALSVRGRVGESGRALLRARWKTLAGGRFSHSIHLKVLDLDLKLGSDGEYRYSVVGNVV